MLMHQFFFLTMELKRFHESFCKMRTFALRNVKTFSCLNFCTLSSVHSFTCNRVFLLIFSCCTSMHGSHGVNVDRFFVYFVLEMFLFGFCF